MSGIELSMSRVKDHLVPQSPAFLDDLQTIPEGKEVMVRITVARNPKQDRWYWAMLGELVKSGWWDGDKESLHRRLKLALGLADEVYGPPEKARIEVSSLMIEVLRGYGVPFEACEAAIKSVIDAADEQPRIYYTLQSISPASMDRTKFESFLRNVEQWLAEQGIDVKQLRKATRAAAGDDAEPKWSQESPEAVLSPGEEGGGAGLPDLAPPPTVDKDLLRRFAETLGKQPTPMHMTHVWEKGVAHYPALNDAAHIPLVEAIRKVHLQGLLEKLPADEVERRITDAIENGVV